MCAVKAKPQLFRDTTTTLPIIIDWLRPTESSRSANAQRAGFLLHRLACNVLLRAFRDCPQWPLALLQVYMEDALGPRAWVDEYEDYGCRTFIANLRTGWNSAVASHESPWLRGRAPSLGSSSSSLRGTPSSTPGQPLHSNTGTDGLLPHLPPLALPPPLAPSLVGSSAEKEREEAGAKGGAKGTAEASASICSDDSDSGDEEVLEEAVVGVLAAPARGPEAPGPGGGHEILNPACREGRALSLDGPPEEVLPRVYPRYSAGSEKAHLLLLRAVQERLESQAYGSLWPLIATLVELAPLAACRRLASEHLQLWLESPATSKNARTLLRAMAKAADPLRAEDTGLVSRLLHLQLPAQQALLYEESMAVVVRKAPEYLQLTVACFMSDAVTGARPDADKILAHILRQALGAVGQTATPGASLSPSTPLPVTASPAGWSHGPGAGGGMPGPVASAPWLTRDEVGRHLARGARGIMREQPGSRVQDALLSVVKTLTLDHVDMLPLVEELLLLSPDTLSTLRHGCGEFLRTVTETVTALLRYRAQVCLDRGKIWNEQHAKAKRAILNSGSATEEELLTQKHYEHWRLRLWTVRDIAAIHSYVARFALHVSQGLLPHLTTSSASLPGPPSAPSDVPPPHGDGLALFRQVLLLSPSALAEPERNDKSPEAFLARYVGVQGSTCRALVALTRLAAGRPRGGRAAVLEQVEDLVRRAGRLVARREADPRVAKADWEDAIKPGVELEFGKEEADGAGIVSDLFGLARYDPGDELLARRGLTPEQVPPLAHSEIFWRVALLLLLVSGSNPSSVGQWLWRHCPTTRCLMQMVVCNQYHFPPPGAVLTADGGDKGSRRNGIKKRTSVGSLSGAFGGGSGDVRGAEGQIMAADTELAEEEAVLSKVLRGERRTGKKRKRLNVNRAGEGDVPDNKPLLSLIFLDLSMPPRTPPADVIERLKALNAEFGIGARLRRATEPDFVAAAIAGDGSRGVSRRMLMTTMEWLAPAVAAEPQVTLRRLPLECICHMYMIAHMKTSQKGHAQPRQHPLGQSGNERGERTPASAVRGALQTLLGPMRRIILDRLFEECEPTVAGAGERSSAVLSSEVEERASKALSVFTDELRAVETLRRAAARRALDELLVHSPERSKRVAEAGMVDAQGDAWVGTDLAVRMGEPGFVARASQVHCAWMFHLQDLPCFRSKPAATLRALYEALQVEASHHVISYYLLGLLFHCHGPAAASGDRFRIRRSKTKGRGYKLSGSFRSPSFFSFVASTVLISRKLVVQAAMEHTPFLRRVLVEEVTATLAESSCAQGDSLATPGEKCTTHDEETTTQSKHAKRVWQSCDLARLCLSCDDLSGPRNVLLPDTLLAACFSLMSMHKGSSIPPVLEQLLGLLFPSAVNAPDGRLLGASGASKVSDAAADVDGMERDEGERAALGPEEWIGLVKCESHVISAAAARCMPHVFLPTLIFCSGLSRDSFYAALSRIEELSKGAKKAETVYRELLWSSSEATRQGSRSLNMQPSLLRKLARHTTAYIQLHAPRNESERATCAGNFCSWLSHEVPSAVSARTLARNEPSDVPKRDDSLTRRRGGPSTFPSTRNRTTTNHMLLESVRGLTLDMEQEEALPEAAPSKERGDSGILTYSSSGIETPCKFPVVPADAEQSIVDFMLPFKMRKEEKDSRDGEGRSSLNKLINRALSAATEASRAELLHVLSQVACSLGSEFVTGPMGRWRWHSKYAHDGEEQLVEVSYIVQLLHRCIRSTAFSVGTGQEGEDSSIEEGGARLIAKLLCQVCLMHWLAVDEEGLGARCQGLIWDLLLSCRSTPYTGSCSNVRHALLSQVLETFSVDELEPLVQRIFKDSGKANLAGASGDGSVESPPFDVYVALSLLNRWFCRPGQSPMVTELGLSPGTRQGLAAAAAARTIPSTTSPLVSLSAQGLSDKSGHPFLVRDGATLSLSPGDLDTVLKLVCQGLALLNGLQGNMGAQRNHSSRDGPTQHLLLFHESIAALCIHLSDRHSTFRRVLMQQLLSLFKDKTTPSSCEAYIVYRLYMAFPADAAIRGRGEYRDTNLMVRALCEGAALQRRPCRSTMDQSLPDDVAHLCRLGLNAQRDSDVVYRLHELAHSHPYLILQTIPALTDILTVDASPDTDRPVVRAPFYFPRPPPVKDGSGHFEPSLPPTSSACGGNEIFLATFASKNEAAPASALQCPSGPLSSIAVELCLPRRVRATFWGLSFRPQLWRAVLDLVMEVPASCMAAYVSASSSGGLGRLEEIMALSSTYVRLLAAQERASQCPPEGASSPPQPPDKVKGKPKKHQLRKQPPGEQEPPLAAPLAFSALHQRPLETGVLNAVESDGCLFYMAERLLLLLRELEKHHPSPVVGFLQTPDPTLGREEKPFDVVRRRLEKIPHVPPGEQSHEQSRSSAPGPAVSVPQPRRV